jgi:deoxyribose-phosphate aldolase
MSFSQKQVARMMDFSAVRADHNAQDIQNLADSARAYGAIAVFALPGWTPTLIDMLTDDPHIAVGGVVGFPSGGESTASKAFQAQELIAMGCSELDMVVNVGRLRSQQYRYVEDDIGAVVAAADEKEVKVILECGLLSNDQIRHGCEACIRAGARFVKTGTGWADCSRIAECVSLMHACGGDAIGIKAAGGIRDLATLVDLYKRGARRFGVGVGSAVHILQQCPEASEAGE